MKKLAIILTIVSPFYFMIAFPLSGLLVGGMDFSRYVIWQWFTLFGISFLVPIVALVLWIIILVDFFKEEGDIKWFFRVAFHILLLAGGLLLILLTKVDPKVNFGLFIFVNVAGIMLINFGCSLLMTICYSNDSKLGTVPRVILSILFVLSGELETFGYAYLGNGLFTMGYLGQGTLPIFNFVLPIWLPISTLITCIIKYKKGHGDWVLYITYLTAPVAVLLVPIIICIVGITGIFLGAAANENITYTYTINGVKAKKIGKGEFEDVKGNKYTGIDESKIKHVEKN